MSDKKRIMFVDDEPNVLRGLERILRQKRHEWDMVFASGVDEALGILNESDVEAVISDITMPGKDGFDLLKTIRSSERTQDIPFVILTGLNDSSIKKNALNLGATDLLNKPADPDELVARINNMLKLKSYQDEIKSHNQHLEQLVKERTAEKTLLQEKLNDSLKKELEIEKVKVETIRTTMYEVHDIVGNFLNNLLLFRMEAEDSNAISEDSLKLFDEIVEEASSRIREVGESNIPEKVS